MLEPQESCLDVEMPKIAQHDTDVHIVARNIEFRNKIAQTITKERHRIKARKTLSRVRIVIPAEEIEVPRDRSRTRILSGAKADPNAKSITRRVAHLAVRTREDRP